MRRVVMLLVIAACGAKKAAPPGDASCRRVGEAWSDYLHDGNRKHPDWAEVAKDLEADCERDAWSQADRSCWVAIRNAADQQRCLDRATHRTTAPPVAPEDSIWEEDEDAGE